MADARSRRPLKAFSEGDSSCPWSAYAGDVEQPNVVPSVLWGWPFPRCHLIRLVFADWLIYGIEIDLVKVLAASVHVPILRTIGFYYKADLADRVTEKASPCTHVICLWSADS
jgi:hypothetical protein